MTDFNNTINDDSLTGTIGSDRFIIPVGGTGAGVDYFFGGAADDTMSGGDGADNLTGGAGNDTFFGGLGGDYFYASSRDADRIFGGTDLVTDWIWLGDDTAGVTVDVAAQRIGLLTFESIEHIVATRFDDTLIGSSGIDSLQGQYGSDIIRAGAGDDFLGLDYVGGTDRDRGYGGAGNDFIISTGGRDIAFGGSGRDRLLVNNDGDQVVTLGGGRQAVLIDGARGLTIRSIEDYWSGNGSDILTGSGGDNHLYAYGGKDTIYGGAGIDLLVGGAGRDRLVGGLGEDQYNGEQGRDRFVFNDTRDSTEFALDQIADFTRGDKIDLRSLTHATGSGTIDIDLTWIGSAAFSGTADEVRFFDDRLQINVASQPGVTMEIVVYGGDVQERDVLL